MFWSGAGFDEEDLQPGTGKFKDASIFYTSVEQINAKDLKRWNKLRSTKLHSGQKLMVFVTTKQKIEQTIRDT